MSQHKLSLIDLMEQIHNGRRPDDFFREDTDWAMVEYLDMISLYTPDDRLIFAARSHDRYKRLEADIDEPAIDPVGIIVFYYILTYDDFYCERLPHTDALYDRLYRAIRDPAVGDFMVFENGSKKPYRVKDAYGVILHSDEEDRRKLQALLIDWD